MRVAFHTNQLSLRGTEVSMFDYAKYNEELLGNKSIVITKHPEIYRYSDPLAIEKFKNRFPVFFYKTNDELQSIIKENNTDVFYAQKAGEIDDVVSKSCKTVVHAVFQHFQPHGDVYAYISEWLSNIYGNRYPFVPYMVDLPDENGDLRKELNIPDEALVYGRHGGYETFDIGFVKDAIKNLVRERDDVYFLFMNTERFSDESYRNIIYLEPTADLVYKTKFINTCDVMIHARIKGETFGLAVAEFSLRNKPVLTYDRSQDMAHKMILKNRGTYYSNEEDIRVYFKIIKKPFNKVDNASMYGDYTPQKVMEKFNKIFLQ